MKFLKLLALPLLLVNLFACSDSGSDRLRIGVMAGPEADLMKVAADKALADFGLEVELIEFSDYISPNVALADGSLDLNAFQHEPYLNSMISDRSFALQKVAATFVYPIGGYSKTLTKLEDLKSGDKVAIPNDPTNEARALLLLDEEGYIGLDDATNLEATPANVISNPLNLQFIELDAAQLPRSLDDVAIAFINSTYSVPSGLIPTRDALVVENKESPYVNLIVSRIDNASDPRIAQLVQSYQTSEVIEKAEELFKGAAVAGW